MLLVADRIMYYFNSHLVTTAIVVLSSLGHVVAATSTAQDWTRNAQDLLTESMTWMDMYYDSDAGYLYSLDSLALVHETRSSVWYAAGLLARNKGNDASEANQIVQNVIASQFKNESAQWYGDYQKYPEEPPIGSAAYPPVIYNSWDPNWRGFIGTTFIVMLEEFPHLLAHDTKTLLLKSLRNATIGDSYRVGGVDDDNLYPSYSNPAIMRAFVSGWTGRALNDSNMTSAGETYATEVITLFQRANTLSEFNSGTYAGVSLFALTLWAKYMPSSSVMGQKGPSMVQHTWSSLAQLYNANLRNVAGPWDRSYGFDMNRYLSILALQIWTLVGKQKAPINAKPWVMGHKDDFAISPLIAILAPFHNKLLEDSSIAQLEAFQGTHTFNTSAFSPPYDTYPRNISAWLSPNMTIGAEAFSENVIGGPAKSPGSFNPAVVQWSRQDGSVGFLTLYANTKSLDVAVGEGSLNLSYPDGNSTSSFTFLVTTNSKHGSPNVASWADVEGVDVDITGTVDPKYSISFAGSNGGADKVINDFEFWNFTYTMPSNSTEMPRVNIAANLAQ